MCVYVCVYISEFTLIWTDNTCWGSIYRSNRFVIIYYNN